MSNPKEEPLANGHFSTSYTGITYRISKEGKKTFYAKYYDKTGRQRNEKLGSPPEYTTARASNERALRAEGKVNPNAVRRLEEKEAKKAKEGRWTLRKLFTNYLKERQPKAAKDDRSRFKNYLEPLADKVPEEINSLEVQTIKQTMQKRGLSQQTQSNVMELLKRISNYGKKQGWSKGLQFYLAIKRANNLITETLTSDEIQNIFNVCEEVEQKGSYELGVAARIMVFEILTGRRHGEMKKLQWKDIDLEKGLMTLVNPKGEKNKIHSFSSSAKEVLLKQKEFSPESSFVFPGRKQNEPIKDIRKSINRIKKMAGLPEDFRPNHGLRHAFASRMVEDGVSLYAVQVQLGHESSTMTQRYAHFQPDSQKEMLENYAKSLKNTEIKKEVLVFEKEKGEVRESQR